MIIAPLSSVLEHLWQSTLFAAASAPLAYALRKNRAHARYWIWLAASLKFLVPFSLLVALGSHIEWTSAARPAFSIAVKQMVQPLGDVPLLLSTSQSREPQVVSSIPLILFAIWLCGLLSVVLSWSRRWLQVRAAVASATPIFLATPIPALSSPALLEPGVFGIVRPVLLLPEGITSHLSRAHLDAILAHELCHVRRHDNLAAAVHMVIEALFWFHPMVWWIGTRLVEERERACDEAVLLLGNQPHTYAESILKTCRFYLESPIECVAGVTGSDLKKRIGNIMSGEVMSRLTILQKMLLVAFGMVAVTVPLSVGFAQTPAAAFEVVSVKTTRPGETNVGFRIKPGAQFTATNVPLRMLVEEAYDVKDSQLSGAPPWFDSERYDIDAKPEETVGAALDKLSPDQRKEQMMKMLQTLLEDRFRLALDHETKDLPIYALIVAKGGPKLHASAFKPPDKPAALPPPPQAGQLPPGGIWAQGPGHITSTGTELSIFANVLSRFGDLGRIVVDRTGLTGRYDFSLQWTPENPGQLPTSADSAPESAGASLFTAIQEQLGLRLEAQKASMPFLVIKHVEKPSAN